MKKLLEDLRKLDKPTWDEIFDLGYYGLPIELSTDETITPCFPERWNDLIQGCIQRAIESKGWTWEIRTSTVYKFAAIVYFPEKFPGVNRGDGDSPAKALLIAYLAAIRSQPCQS